MKKKDTFYILNVIGLIFIILGMLGPLSTLPEKYVRTKLDIPPIKYTFPSNSISAIPFDLMLFLGIVTVLAILTYLIFTKKTYEQYLKVFIPISLISLFYVLYVFIYLQGTVFTWYHAISKVQNPDLEYVTYSWGTYSLILGFAMVSFAGCLLAISKNKKIENSTKMP